MQLHALLHVSSSHVHNQKSIMNLIRVPQESANAKPPPSARMSPLAPYRPQSWPSDAGFGFAIRDLCNPRAHPVSPRFCRYDCCNYCFTYYFWTTTTSSSSSSLPSSSPTPPSDDHYFHYDYDYYYSCCCCCHHHHHQQQQQQEEQEQEQ